MRRDPAGTQLCTIESGLAAAAGMKAIREWWWRADSLAARCLRRTDNSVPRTCAKCVDVCPYHSVRAVDRRAAFLAEHRILR